MKHRLSALLDGMEMTRSEHDWLEQRFDNMTAKEELLFRGAVGIEHPEALQDAIQSLQSLEHYRLLYGADDDVTLGRFVMEHIHSPTPAARAYAHLLHHPDGIRCAQGILLQSEAGRDPAHPDRGRQPVHVLHPQGLH